MSKTWYPGYHTKIAGSWCSMLKRKINWQFLTPPHMKLLPSPTVPVGLQASMALGTAAVRLGTGRGPHGPRPTHRKWLKNPELYMECPHLYNGIIYIYGLYMLMDYQSLTKWDAHPSRGALWCHQTWLARKLPNQMEVYSWVLLNRSQSMVNIYFK